MKDDRLYKWFEDLEAQIPSSPSDYDERFIEPHVWKGWALSCINILALAFGKGSVYYSQFVETLDACEYETDFNIRQVRSMYSILRSAKNDYCNGYVDIDLKITGDVLGDLVALAKEALKEEHLHVAAVLAAASLEDALKRFASANNIDTEGSRMDEVVSALKAKGLIPRGMNKALQPMPSIRNYALHAEWDKLTEVEIGGLIGFVETFLIKHFYSEDV